LSQEKHFQNYHRVLNRAVWSSLDASRILLTILVNTFALFGPIVFGLDDTIERRRGEQIIKWFVRRWQVEVTFHEVRTHLGVETQRQWFDLSSLRITPALLSLFSLVTLLANCHAQKNQLLIQRTAWYNKKLPTFSDALATVKQNFGPESFSEHHTKTMTIKIVVLSF
jgi:hypothetical protein